MTANALTGVIGEHMAYYWMAKQLGLRPSHDNGKPISGELRKLNAGGRLYQLHVPSPNPKGIDSLWKVDGKVGGKPYCIVEAKASATSMTKSIGALLTDGRDKTERKTAANQQQVQMSTKWCDSKLKQLNQNLSVGRNYSRRVVFFNATAIKEHLATQAEIIQYLADPKKSNELSRAMAKHQKHEPTRIFTDAEIDLWVFRRIGETDGKGSTKANKRKK